MTAEGFRLCPTCREEYTLAVLRCVECDVVLVAPGEIPEEPVALEMPPASQLECVRVAPRAWVRALSGALEELGVAHRVEPSSPQDAPEGQTAESFGDADLFGLYVRGDALAAAREIDGRIEEQVLPREGEALGEGDTDACPACGSDLSDVAEECPDCGLPFA